MKKTFFMVCTLLLLLTACKGKRVEPHIIYTDLQPLTLGAMPSMDYLPYIVAKKDGIYDSLGLDLHIVKFFSANDRDAAFQSANVDGTVIEYIGAALQQANGVPLSIVVQHDGYFYLVAGKESKIENIEHLKGKNIAISRNTAIEYSIDKALERAKISQGEVNKPEISKIPLKLEMLQSKQIDATILPDPFATIAIHNGHHSVITTRDLGVSITGTIFSKKALKDKRREIETLLRGYNLAVDRLNSSPASVFSQILIDDVGVPEALTSDIIFPKYQKATLPSEKDLSAIISWLKENHLCRKTITKNYLLIQLTASDIIK